MRVIWYKKTDASDTSTHYPGDADFYRVNKTMETYDKSR